MESSSEQSLFQVFQGIIEWRSSQGSLIPQEATIPWSQSHLKIVYKYILKLGRINSNFKLLYSSKKLPFSREAVASFMQELQKFFILPKLHQLYGENNPKALQKNELLAAFINFLLQLLHQKTDFVHSFEDRIEDFKKELRFLVTVMGDSLLQDDELEQVKKLLVEIEALMNEAGRLVYSFVFTMDGVHLATRMDDDLDALFDHINILKAKIIKFSDSHVDLSTRKTVAVHSLFIVDSLLYDLEDLMNRHEDRIVVAMDQIKVLHQELTFSKSLLDGIKLPRRTGIEEAMNQIRDVGCEAEHLINSFLVEDAPLGYLTIRLPKVIHKIKLIGTEMQKSKKNYDNIEVLKVVKDLNAQVSLHAKRNYAVDGFTVGLEDKERSILDQLVGGTQHLQIISIFGMPGIGKTTLANKVYHHPTVNYYFDKRSLSVVSQTYQRKNLLIDIIISLGSELDKVKISNTEEESLGEHIYKSLKGRRYLIVMDDIWDSNVWHDVRRYFHDDGNGSRILFTSRNKDTALSNSIIYALASLSNDQSWELLQKKVFHNKPCPPQLLGIGRKIAANCNGLPLAVVVIAGILSTMDNEESTWEKVGGGLASYIFSDQDNSMMQILKLSYKHLPDHLKPCFLYFGIFPEDEVVPVQKLIRLWIAEGFLCKAKKKSAENVGEEYLTELVDRSLVIVAKRRSDGGVKACVVHDLFHELCLGIAKEENFLKLMDDNYSIYTKHHRLRVHNIKPEPMAPCEYFLPFGLHLRSLIVAHQDLPWLSYRKKKLLIRAMDLPRLIRVLDSPIFELNDVDGIEHLFHLRYLSIEYMPSSIDSLVNLEFLIINSLSLLGLIPSVIQKMVKLRYFKTPLAKFDEDWNISKTSNLEFLSSVQIDELKDEEKLKCLPHLRKLKCSCRLFRNEKGAYRCPDLRFLTQLESLSMTTSFGHPTAEINFPANIKKLTLGGLRLPWEKMSIIGGLPNLQVLKLGYEAFIGEIWQTEDGEFQQLRFLKMYGLNLVKWNVASMEHFPKLQQLMLRKCLYLQEIPSEIGEIATLQLIELELCPKSVGESAIQIEEEQKDLGNEELRVIISREY